jgi:heme/copper-type cytochrome/quinol oxidase subunit 3
MVEDVVFHEFAHETVDRAAGGSETAKNLGALFVGVQALEYRLELTDNLFWSGLPSPVFL